MACGNDCPAQPKTIQLISIYSHSLMECYRLLPCLLLKFRELPIRKCVETPD